jgi:hypothetical protein
MAVKVKSVGAGQNDAMMASAVMAERDGGVDRCGHEIL